MSYGLEVYDAQGNLIVSPDINMSIILGYITTGTEDGSHTDGNLNMSKGFAVSCGYTQNDSDPNYLRKNPPHISVDGDTVSWKFGNMAAENRANIQIMYGVCGL